MNLRPSLSSRVLTISALALTTLIAPTALKATPNKSPLVHVIMTVDWEGRNLNPSNIAAMQQLRQDYPTLPILHYLNAAYYFKSGANAEQTTDTIRSTLLPIDQLGLHIHGWQSLFTAAGVTFRNQPNWNPGGKPLTDAECASDCGHSIPIRAYSEAELSQVIKFSIDTLSSHGFGRAQHFRAGGWMLSQRVSNALTANGIVSDSSAVPAEFLHARLYNYPLYQWAVQTWTGITQTSQPYLLTTKHGALLEVPDNGCLADYMSGAQMLTVLKANLAEAQASGEERIVVVGFHQETADDWLPHIRDFLSGAFALNANGQVVSFGAMPTQL